MMWVVVLYFWIDYFACELFGFIAEFVFFYGFWG